MRGLQPIIRPGYWLLTAVAAALLVISCSTDDGAVYRVVGGGSSCDAEACPPGRATYSLRLVAPSESPADARSYDLAGDAQHRESVAAYPECVLARIDGGDVVSWEPASCP